MKKICLNCKKEYEAKSKKSKYCCEKCKSEYKYNNMKNHSFICLNCNKKFNSYRKDAKFCSKECSSLYYKNINREPINLNDIINFVKNNEQMTLEELTNLLGVGNNSIYKNINKIGFTSYKEFVKYIKGEYLEKNRSDVSISALKCFDIVSKILNENYETEVCFDGLINPRTNHKLRIDCYFKKSNIAIEYNGIQHYKNIPFFHNDKNSLEYQKYKDELKKDYCKNNNIKLIVISYKDKLTPKNIKNIIDSEVISNQARRMSK